MPAHTHPGRVTSLVLLHSTLSAVRCYLRAPRLPHSAPRESPHQPSRAGSHPCCTLQPRGHLVPVPGDLQDSNVTDPEWGPGIRAFVEHIPTGNQSWDSGSSRCSSCFGLVFNLIGSPDPWPLLAHHHPRLSSFPFSGLLSSQPVLIPCFIHLCHSFSSILNSLDLSYLHNNYGNPPKKQTNKRKTPI